MRLPWGNTVISFTNFTLLPTGWFSIAYATVNLGAGCSMQGKFTYDGGADSKSLNFNAGSSCMSGNLSVYGGTVNDNVGITPDSLKLLGYYDDDPYELRWAYFNSAFSVSIPKLIMNNGVLQGSGVMTVTAEFRTGTDWLHPAAIQNTKELKIAGANNSIVKPINLYNTSKITFESGTTTVWDNGFNVGGIELYSAATTATVEIKLTANLVSNYGYAKIEPSITSSGNFTGKFHLGGRGNRSHNFNAGAINGQLRFYSSTSGTPDIFNLNNLAINSGTIEIGYTDGNSVFISPTVNLNSTCTVNNAVAFQLKSGTFEDNVGISPTPQFVFYHGSYKGNTSPVFNGGLDLSQSELTVRSFYGSGTVSIYGAVVGPGKFTVVDSKEVRIYGTAYVQHLTCNGTSKIVFMSGSTVTSKFGIFGNSTVGFEQQVGSTWTIEGFPGNTNTPHHNAKVLVKGTVNINAASPFKYQPSANCNFQDATINIPSGKTLELTGNLANYLNLTNTAVLGAGTFRLNANMTVLFKTGSSISNTIKLKVENGGQLYDEVGLTPGEVTLSSSSSEYRGPGSPLFANGLIWNNGWFDGSGIISVIGPMTSTAGYIDGSKVLFIGGTATLSTGTITLLTSNTKIVVQNGGLFTINSGSVSGSFTSRVEVNSGGVLTKSTASNSTCPLLVQTGGIVNVNGGTLNLKTVGGAAVWPYHGTLNVAAGTTANFQNHTCDFKGPTFNNSGTVTIGAGYLMTFSGTSAQTVGGSGGVFPNLTLNNSNNMTLTGAPRVAGELNFTAGKILLQNGDLTVGSIAGASASNYIATTGTGRLRMNVGTSALLFPVGPNANATNYNPITLSQTSGADTFAVRVKIGFDHPTNGTDYVDRQWNIDRSPGNSTAATAIFGWATGHQSGNFDPADCHVSRWNGSSWDAFASGPASCVAGICERTQSGITSFSPFGVATGQSLLPIELTFFNAQKIAEKTANLTWQTASENNNRGFEIQRSGNGIDWQTIGFKNGNGTTSEPSDYFFVDEKPFDGPNFYRLRQLDFDGKTSFSNIEHLEFGSPEEESFRLYPNPAFAGDALIFEWKNSHEPETELTIFDALGRPVFSQKLEPTNSDLEQMEVNTLRFAAGWHTARLRSGDRATVKKFLVTGY